jgi:multicomponent K+:H+ antiporter subunit E
VKQTLTSLRLVLVLVAMWLALNQTLAPGQAVLGAALAAALVSAAVSLRPLHARPRRVHVAAGLALTVLTDVVRSNLAVARIVLGFPRRREVRAGFLDVPLDLRDPHGVAALAVIVTATPGTLWVRLSPDGNAVRLHVLDLEDEEQSIRWIKTRYERPLMRIFE